MADLAAELVDEVAQLQAQLKNLGSEASDSDTVIEQVRQLALQLAATHNKLHLWAVTANGVQGQSDWQQELAEYQCLDLEDSMEAVYLLIQKQQYKLSGEQAVPFIICNRLLRCCVIMCLHVLSASVELHRHFLSAVVLSAWCDIVRCKVG